MRCCQEGKTHSRVISVMDWTPQCLDLKITEVVWDYPTSFYYTQDQNQSTADDQYP